MGVPWGTWPTLPPPVNSDRWLGIKPGSVRLVAVRATRPPWWRRLWAHLTGRPLPVATTFEFEVIS